MSFAREVEDACENALIRLGFSRPRRGTIVLEVDGQFSGWVGLNRGAKRDSVDVYPFAGIHANEVERTLAQHRGERYRAGAIATFARPLSSVDEHVTHFEFTRGQNVERTAALLAHTLASLKHSFFEASANYSTLLSKIVPEETMGGGKPERIAVIYYLQGDPAKAVKYLEWILGKFESRDHQTICASIREFSDPFISFLTEQRT